MTVASGVVTVPGPRPAPAPHGIVAGEDPVAPAVSGGDEHQGDAPIANRPGGLEDRGRRRQQQRLLPRDEA
jgi:hypothetical protein